ncbi:hypothetical protein HWV03_08685 [Moritella sp. 36]|uniref:hypothetical protein n=1 Tax=Moritella sp. 36 TaxID=2746233 RepID=UPI001BAC1E46|nr:hypothetical protein [Moritella sp. 36]QUM88866.1 hypothetical protein HWV03_08685 [Moritella sp. 36]
MPGEIVGEVFSGVFRFIFRFFVEIIVEILIKGLGYLIYRPFNKNVDPDGFKVTMVGLIFWVLIFFGAYEIMAFIEIDSCLDSGGSYNYQFDECEQSVN